MVIEISDDIQQSTIESLIKSLERAKKRKGTFSFNSIWEIFGKLQEEVYEVLREIHKKDKEIICEELMDVAVVAIWGIMSIRANEEKK